MPISLPLQLNEPIKYLNSSRQENFCVVFVEKAIILVEYTYYQEIWGLEATSLRIVVKTH